MKNEGINTHRLKQNPLEREFAKAWEDLNNGTHGRNDLIEYLLSDEPNNPKAVSERDRVVAATIIQWLGTPVGQHFINDIK